jgi:putative ABC transport system permease protein
MAFSAISNKWKRYLFLTLALSSGFALILLLTGLAGAMKQNVTEAAARHYGGNLFVLGHQKIPYYTPVIRDNAALFAAVKEAGIHPALVIQRTNFFENGQVFFNGYSSRQKTVTGIDWDTEAPIFAGLEFASGGFSGMKGSNGILISNVTAKQLSARVGDDVILEVDTVTGQRNTASLVVKGIFEDASIFGAYTSYVDIDLLSSLIGLSPGEYTTFGIYLRDPSSASSDSPRLYAALAKKLPMFAPVETQQDLWVRLGESWTGVKYAVLTLDGYLSDIKDLTSAIDAGLYLLLVLMLVIITLGTGNTYRVMIHERVREFGTMRALGMQREAVSRLVITEALLLGTLCIVMGTVMGFALLVAAGSIRITGIPGFDIFLRKGALGWHLSPITYVVDALFVVFAVLAGGLIPARRASSVEPARALRRDA